jgi:Tfp pilus assembly protein PilX
MRSRSRFVKKRKPLSLFSKPRRRSWQSLSKSRHANQGFTLIVVVFISIMLVGLLTAYMLLSKGENTNAASSNDSSSGFYAAESGLSLRAKTILDRFQNRSRPTGTSPTSIDACTNGSTTDNGTADFACQSFNMSKSLDGVARNAVTYMVETTQYTGTGTNRTPIMKTIPPDEPFAGLNAQENSYQLNSVGRKMTDPPQTEAVLSMDLKSRVVPMFQFAAFYDKDLEILPSPVMTLAGPVHTNGDLYLGGSNTLTLQGQVTIGATRDTSDINIVTGGIYNRRKDDNSTFADGKVKVNNTSSTPINLLSGATGSTSTTTDRLNSTTVQSDGIINADRIKTTWGSRIVVPSPRLQMPDAGFLSTSGDYYNKGDLRISYTPSTSTTQATVRQSVPMAIAKVNQASGATATNLSEGQLRSLLQPVLGGTAVSASTTGKGTVVTTGNWPTNTDPTSTGGPLNSFSFLSSQQKQEIVRALQVSILAQSTPINFSSMGLSVSPNLNSAPYTVDTLFSGASDTYLNTGTNFLDRLMTTGSLSSLTTTQKSSLKTLLRQRTPIEIAGLTQQSWFPAAFMDVGGLNPTTYYNDREAKEMRLLQINLSSLTIWNRDGVYLNYSSGAVSDNATTQMTYITNNTLPSANQLLFNLASSDSVAPANSFQRLGYAGSDTTDGGYVVHMTIDNATYTTATGTTASPGNSPYGFIISQGNDLFGLALTTTTPDPTGITFASDQAIYVQGDLNSFNKQPSATLSDTLNVLSNACTTADIRLRKTSGKGCNSALTGTGKFDATTTTINAGFLAGTDETNSSVTSGYNGGLENYPRFAENWSGDTLNYAGSFVSLGIPQKVRGRWGAQAYDPPARNWGFDVSFRDVNKLPPLDPRFVYLKQDTFVRSFPE